MSNVVHVRLSFATSFLVVGIIFIWDCCNRCKLYISSEKKTHSMQKCLNIVSFSIICVMMLDIITNAVFTFPALCEYINFQHIPTEALTPTLIALYQVARLHYCFNNELNTYSKCIYKILYIIPILWFIYIIIIDQIRFILMQLPSTCFFIPAVTPKTFWILSSIAMFFRYPYDWMVVGIYIHRVRKLVRYNQKSGYKSRSTQNAEGIMRRILILTIFINIIMILHRFTNLTATVTGFRFYNVHFQKFLYALDILKRDIVCFCVFLMLQHNTSTYNKLITLCLKFKFCFCCKKFVYKSIPNADDKDVVTKNDRENKVPLQLEFSGFNQSMDNTFLAVSTKSTTNMTVTSTNVTAKINHTNFPQFTLEPKYMKESEIIYVVLIKRRLFISIPLITQIISEYAATLYKTCIRCDKKYGYIECFYDYFVVNNALANCDPSCDDEIRYYLNCDPSYSTNIQNNVDNYDENVDILCVECGEKWKCTQCFTQFLSYSHESLLIMDGCDICKTIICEDCALVYDNKILCESCCPESTDKDMISSYKSYKLLESKSTSKRTEIGSTNNDFSKWRNFQF